MLALTAWNEDDASSCPGPSCVKNVRSSGTVSTADVFASGRCVRACVRYSNVLCLSTV